MDSVDEDLHKWAYKAIKDSRSHFKSDREEKRIDYDFYAGRQWTDDETLDLESQGRPAVAFNRCCRTINAIVGMEVQNRQEVRYFPREMRDSQQSELLTNAAKWVRDSCDAEDEESEGFQDTLICGEGWTETRMDFSDDDEGMIVVERCDPLDMGVDPSSRKRNFDDARYKFKIKKYSKEEYKSRFGGEIPQKTRFGESTDEGMATLTDNAGRDAYESDDTSESASTKDIEVAQFQYYTEEKRHAVNDAQSGKKIYLSSAKLKKMRATLDAQGVEYSKEAQPHRQYYQIFLTPEGIIEDKTELECGFTFRAITGLRDRNEASWFGLIRLMRDPQKWANKWMIQIQHILNSQAKAGKVAFETGALKNPAKAMDEWGDPSKPVELNAQGLQKLLQLQPAAYPVGLDRLLAYALEAVNDAPGTNAEMLGLADRQQPGVLEQQRKQAGITIVATFFDSLRRYRKEQGRVLAGYIRKYIADGRLIRITGETGEEAIPLLRDSLSMKYDVVVDDAPTSPNVKEKTFGVLRELLPALQQAGVPLPPDLIEYAPLPSSLIQKWKKYISEQSENPEVQQTKQLAIEAQTADTESKKAKAMKDQADAQKTLSEIGQDTGGMEAGKHDKELQAKVFMKQMELESQERIAGMRTQADSQSKREMAQATAKPTVQLGGDDVTGVIGEAFMSISQQNQMMIQAMLESQKEQSALLVQALQGSMSQVADSMNQVGMALSADTVFIEQDGKPIGARKIIN